MSSPISENVVSGSPVSPPSSVEAGRQNSYGQALKSSALIGGSAMVNVGIGIIRTKAMALLVGPTGMGLVGIFTSVTDMAQAISGMGINSSGVRQIAAAVASDESERIARTVVVLRRTSIALGLLGAGLLIAFSKPISMVTFGSAQYTSAITILSLAVLFRSISAGQGALLQGLRRISDLVKVGIIGTISGTLISILVVYFFHEKGIVPSLIILSVSASLISWWYARKVRIVLPSMTGMEVRREVFGLLNLGFIFMASGFLTLGAAYAIRVIVLRQMGLDAAGIYQSAWSLGGMYVGFILSAMGTDFYPRLTAVAHDNAECNRLVNEQAQINLLVAGPGAVATLTLAPLVITLFYSAEFNAAVEVLRWICLGMILRVLAWPMGFIVVAKGAKKIFFWTEVAATTVHVGLAWLFVIPFGLAGVGAAFFGLYIWHGILIYFIVRRLSGFCWSAENVRIGGLFLALTVMVFVGFYLLPFWSATSIGVIAALWSGVYSVKSLLHLVPSNRIPLSIRRVLVWLRMAPPSII